MIIIMAIKMGDNEKGGENAQLNDSVVFCNGSSCAELLQILLKF